MYLMATHIPIYLDGGRTYINDSWYSDLELGSRFFSRHFGPIALIGPSLPIELADAMHMREVGPDMPNLSLHPSIDARTRIRRFWPAAARQWQADLAPLLREASVVHASVDDPFRPMQLAAMRAALKANKPTVLIGFDMDIWDLLDDKLRQMGRIEGKLHVARTAGMEFWMRHCVRRASVAMLKEGLVYDRYAPMAKNPKEFCHSMHSEADVVSEGELDERLTSLASGRPLRFAYFGRFVERKGLADAIRVLAAARGRGVDASYDLIGDGPQRHELETLAKELGIAESVRFPGSFPYGVALHERLRTYDAVLFTPTEEDTPRMVYDAFASGLPLITSDIAFLRRRADRDQASVLFEIGAIEEGATRLVELNQDRERLVSLSRKAHEAGGRHSVERWYGQRLAWTVEAVERHGY